MNVTPEQYARDIELLARRGRIMGILFSGREVTVGELAMELEMAPVNVRFVLADLLEDGLVKVDFEPVIETWRLA
jgi:DNA-binding transcriptional ArsR family regulator